MRRNSTARAIALVSVGLVVAGGLGVGVASSASASAVVSTPGVTTTTLGDYPSAEAVSPDNEWLYVTSSFRGLVWAIDVHTKKVTATITVAGARDVAFSRTGAHAYVLSGDSIAIIDTASKKVTAKVTDPIGASSVRLESGGRYLLMTRAQGPEAALFDTLTNKTTVLPDGPTDDAEQYSASGATAYGLDVDADTGSTTYVRSSAASGAVLSRSSAWAGNLSQNDLAVASDGSIAAVMEPLAVDSATDSDRTVDILSAHTGQVLRTATVSGEGSFRHIGVSPDGSAVTVLLGGTLTVLDSATGVVRGSDELSQPSDDWSYSPDGTRLLVVENLGSSAAGVADDIALSDARVRNRIQVGRAPGVVLPSPTGHTMYVINYSSGTVTTATVTGSGFRPAIRQDWGSDRYGTSIVESRLVSGPGALDTYLTSDADPALTLGVAAVAGADRSDQFLVIPKTGASSSAIAEIKRATPDRIYVVGDESVVSAAAFSALEKTFGSKVVRVAGADSSATLVAASETTDESRGTVAKQVIVADRDSYAAALAAPYTAASDRAAYVLVDGSAQSLPESVRTYLTADSSLDDDLDFTVMGSEKTISAGIADELGELGTVTRMSGSDRYAIAQALTGTATNTPSEVIAVNGDDVIDAAMAASRGPIVGGVLDLVHSTCVPTAVAAEWKRVPAVQLTLMGSPSQLGSGVAAAKACS